MAYITREDGEHFVIPSYRDVLTAKNKNQLKRDILLLSQNYGEYITLQRKSATQYEIAFSPDTGYLLGESVWHYLKRPVDMIYCEAIPNTTEALMVIVKNGSVYLDGSFPLENISEELVIFLTQQNQFEIYIYGNVPISDSHEEGKFTFEAGSVKSFNRLDKPIFPTLPLMRMYQLQLVDPVLRAHGIGVFPLRQVIFVFVILGVVWFLYSYLTSRREIAPVTFVQANPYIEFNNELATIAPDQTIDQFLGDLRVLFSMPGWTISKVSFEKGLFTFTVKSGGGTIQNLTTWAQNNHARVDITQDGIKILMNVVLFNRPIPRQIYPVKQVMGNFIDNLSRVYPGNHMQMGEITNKGSFTRIIFTIMLDHVTPVVVALIGAQLKDSPMVLQKINFAVENGNLTGSITLEALGS